MIKFVYFDVGGVVVKDFSGSNKWDEMQKDLGVNERNKLKFESVWKRHRDRICIDFDVDDIFSIIAKECNLEMPENYSMLDDFVDRFEKNESIWPVIKIISKSSRIGLLTNMYPRMFQKISSRDLLPPHNFEIKVDSSVVRVRKPDTEIFKIAERSAGISSQDILFIDNSEENVHSASSLGFKVFYYDSDNFELSSRKLLDYYLSIK